jgi:uncharacterized repeat protein (TIGR03803 family)
MRNLRFLSLLALAAVLLPVAAMGAAKSEKVLYSFKPTDITTGADLPSLTVTIDSAGNLYAVAAASGTFSEGNGAILQLTPSASGGWTTKAILTFDETNGERPNPSLIFDSKGNLYGTTQGGGSTGEGVAFELVRSSKGTWSEKILHTFGANGNDGAAPLGGVIFDSAGNLYGTTEGGGSHATGMVYKLSPTTRGNWTETILYNFAAGIDGSAPSASLVFDGAGNLYGTTLFGGQLNSGTVFELSPQVNGTWEESVLYSFEAGSQPESTLVLDSSGNLYGTDPFSNVSNGFVFELSPQSDGSWTEKTLYEFKGGKDGSNVLAGVVFDKAGNLYGATFDGGTHGGLNPFGTIYKLAPIAGGGWKKTALWDFNGPNGAFPGLGTLTIDASGNIFGATEGGGTNGHGAVFEITP